jgi:archaellum component FlaC
MDAIDFCRRLLKAEDSFGRLKSGLDNIKDVAKNAHQDALEMNRQFKDIRVELFKVHSMLITPPTLIGFPCY